MCIRDRPKVSWKSKENLILGLLILGIGASHLVSRRGFTAERLALLSFFPTEAVQFIKNNPQLPKKMWNPYGWGGFLLWQLGPDTKIYFDGRAHTVYPEKVYSDGYFIQYGEPWRRILRNRGLEPPSGTRLQVLDEYAVDLVLVDRNQGDLGIVLSQSIHWNSIYQDSKCILFLRQNTKS